MKTFIKYTILFCLAITTMWLGQKTGADWLFGWIGGILVIRILELIENK